MLGTPCEQWRPLTLSPIPCQAQDAGSQQRTPRVPQTQACVGSTSLTPDSQLSPARLGTGSRTPNAPGVRTHMSCSQPRAYWLPPGLCSGLSAAFLLDISSVARFCLAYRGAGVPGRPPAGWHVYPPAAQATALEGALNHGSLHGHLQQARPPSPNQAPHWSASPPRPHPPARLGLGPEEHGAQHLMEPLLHVAGNQTSQRFPCPAPGSPLATTFAPTVGPSTSGSGVCPLPEPSSPSLPP